jgi:hypothetical protein
VEVKRVITLSGFANMTFSVENLNCIVVSGDDGTHIKIIESRFIAEVETNRGMRAAPEAAVCTASFASRWT